MRTKTMNGSVSRSASGLPRSRHWDSRLIPECTNDARFESDRPSVFQFLLELGTTGAIGWKTRCKFPETAVEIVNSLFQAIMELNVDTCRFLHFTLIKINRKHDDKNRSCVVSGIAG